MRMRAGCVSGSVVLLLVASGLVSCSAGDASKATPVESTTIPLPSDTVTASTPVATDSPSTTAAALPSVDVPAPPAAAPLPAGTPQEQAASLDQLVTATTADPVSGGLAVYDAVGIPVIGGDGKGVGSTGDDPIGPGFDLVWMLSGAAIGGSGLPLSDVVRMYVDDDAQSAGVGDVLLADLRADASNADPHVALFGNFVAERARHSGPANDLLDPSATAADVYVDAATAELISWVALRDMSAVAAAGRTSIMSGLRSTTGVAPRTRRVDTPCAEALGDEDTTFWVNFLSNKIGSGLELPGMTSALKGLVEKLAELNPHLLDVDKVKAASALAKKANLIGGLLSLLMQVSSLTVDASEDPQPLQRHKLKSDGDGESTTITWIVRMDLGSLPDGNKKMACAATAILNFLGVGFSFPADGALPGVDLTFQGHLGFAKALDETGAYVYQDESELKMTTGADGSTQTKITARAQKHDFSDSAKKINREFSLDVAAQVEPENARSLFNVFFDGFTASDALGVGSAAIDIAKTLHWDMGERVFVMADWQAGWKIDQVLRGWHFTGIVCDTNKPFTLDAVLDADVSGTYSFTPTGTGPLTWTFAGMANGAFPLSANGGGNIQTPENAEAVVHIDNTGQLIAQLPGVGPAPLPGISLDSGDLVLVPLDTEECSAG